jgi:hypothetical protein
MGYELGTGNVGYLAPPLTHSGRNLELATFGNANVQSGYRDGYEPRVGYDEPPAGPGFGYQLDAGKITRRVDC